MSVAHQSEFWCCFEELWSWPVVLLHMELWSNHHFYKTYHIWMGFIFSELLVHIPATQLAYNCLLNMRPRVQCIRFCLFVLWRRARKAEQHCVGSQFIYVRINYVQHSDLLVLVTVAWFCTLYLTKSTTQISFLGTKPRNSCSFCAKFNLDWVLIIWRLSTYVWGQKLDQGHKY